MSKRPEPNRKKTPDFYADLIDGHREAAYGGTTAARKYLERTLTGQHSLPNAVKFFAYDLLAGAAHADGQASTRDDAVTQAIAYLPAAQEDLPRELAAWLPQIQCFEVGIGALVDDGQFEAALALCEQAIALGLGKVYEQKADSIRWMI